MTTPRSKVGELAERLRSGEAIGVVCTAQEPCVRCQSADALSSYASLVEELTTLCDGRGRESNGFVFCDGRFIHWDTAVRAIIDKAMGAKA